MILHGKITLYGFDRVILEPNTSGITIKRFEEISNADRRTFDYKYDDNGDLYAIDSSPDTSYYWRLSRLENTELINE